MIKNVKFVELNIRNATVFLNTQTLKMIEQKTNPYVLTKFIDKKLMKT